MGGNPAVIVPQTYYVAKVHSTMCTELKNMLDRIIFIIPAIESAQPGCKAGIDELCNLNISTRKGKDILRTCSESSKLYSALTGDTIMQRCENIRNSFSRSLFTIQNMVPPPLASQIADILAYLANMNFTIEPRELEAGRALMELFQLNDPTEDQELSLFQLAAVNLNITTPKSTLIEKRSIKKLLRETPDTNTKKLRILSYFLDLMEKYKKNIKLEDSDHDIPNTDSPSATERWSEIETNFREACVIVSSDHAEHLPDWSESNLPPHEFLCPISGLLMHDPVIIDSGQTYERKHIEKWFNKGYDTCPKTKRKLKNLSVTPNVAMRDLISKWRQANGGNGASGPLSSDWPYGLSETSVGHSISSLTNVPAPLISEKSSHYKYKLLNCGCSHSTSCDVSFMSDSSDSQFINEPRLFSWSFDYQKCPSFRGFDHDMFLKFFNELAGLTLEPQKKAIDEMEKLLDSDDMACGWLASNGFSDAFISFLKNIRSERANLRSLKAGAQLFLAFLKRNGAPSLSEEAFDLITSFLDSDLKMESLLILKELACHQSFKSWLLLSPLHHTVIKLLDRKQADELLQPTMDIFLQLSTDSDMKPTLVATGVISKLAEILSDERFPEHCLSILENLLELKEAAALMISANGCIGSCAEYLDRGTRKEQDYSAAILYAVCLQSTGNCSLVMKEGVIPALVSVAVNGSNKGKQNATDLLHLLRGLRHTEPLSSPRMQQPVTETLEVSVSAEMTHLDKPPTKERKSRLSQIFQPFPKSRSVALS